jgi:hypothetical protein
LSGRGLCDELITRPEKSYRLCCVIVCDLETSRVDASYIYIYDIRSLRVNDIQVIKRELKVCEILATLLSIINLIKYMQLIWLEFPSFEQILLLNWLELRLDNTSATHPDMEYFHYVEPNYSSALFWGSLRRQVLNLRVRFICVLCAACLWCNTTLQICEKIAQV